MPRIIVTTDSAVQGDDPAILLDETVRSVHLSTGHATAQLVERLAWAVSDAESAEHAENRRPRHSRAPRSGPLPARHSSSHQALTV